MEGKITQITVCAVEERPLPHSLRKKEADSLIGTFAVPQKTREADFSTILFLLLYSTEFWSFSLSSSGLISLLRRIHVPKKWRVLSSPAKPSKKRIKTSALECRKRVSTHNTQYTFSSSTSVQNQSALTTNTTTQSSTGERKHCPSTEPRRRKEKPHAFFLLCYFPCYIFRQLHQEKRFSIIALQ